MSNEIEYEISEVHEDNGNNNNVVTILDEKYFALSEQMIEVF